MNAYRECQTVVKRVAELHLLPDSVRVALVTEDGRYSGMWERGEADVSDVWHFPPKVEGQPHVIKWFSFPSVVLSGAKILP